MGTVRYLPRATNLMFVGLETGTIDVCDSSARVVDISSTGFVADGDDYVDDIDILNLAESDGVPVADLWAAYEWRRAMVTAGILADVEHYVVRLHGEPAGGTECEQCGETDPYVNDKCGRVCTECGHVPNDGRAGDDQDYDNAHRCTDCGVTGGGVSDGVCQDCDGERQRNAGDGWEWRADRGGWTHCDDRAEYDDDGATCRKCYRFMSHDDAAARMIE